MIKKIDVTKRGMEEAIRTYTQQLKNYDMGLVHYSGHGFQIEGINYLVPTDALHIESAIDAKYARANEVRRFCYINAIMQTKPDDFYSGRSPIQAGAEIYGEASLKADAEIINLMLESMKIVGVAADKANQMVLSIGHVSIINHLLAHDQLSSGERERLFAILNRKSKRDLGEFIEHTPLKYAELLLQLIDLNGGAAVLDEARRYLTDDEKLSGMIDELAQIASLFAERVAVYIDLAEVKGYEYHSGLLFSLYHVNYKKALAQGGRYDDLSSHFGRSRRFATGFSFDLKHLIQQL